MPSKQRRYCAESGCNNYAENGYYCTEHKPQVIRVKKAYESWYNKAQWLNIRKQHLIKEPLCRECKRHGIYTKGNEVDHIIPHKGNFKLFIDRVNLQTLCTSCHSKKTMRENSRKG